MAFHVYVVPKAGDGVIVGFHPKYIGEGGIVGPWQAVDYGEEDTFIVFADTTNAEHTAISANADVTAVGALDSAVGGNPTLTRVRNELEARFIPGSWVLAASTWRQVVARSLKCAHIVQRMRGSLGRRMFGSGVNLGTVLTAPLVADFVATGQTFGMDTTAITTALTVREAILVLADQRPARTVNLRTVPVEVF